jgi:hypothetical protein
MSLNFGHEQRGYGIGEAWMLWRCLGKKNWKLALLGDEIGKIGELGWDVDVTSLVPCVWRLSGS